MYESNPVGVKLFSHVNAFVGFMLDTIIFDRSHILRLCQYVPTGHNTDKSIRTRRTQSLDTLVHMLMLMSRPSSLAHKLLLC